MKRTFAISDIHGEYDKFTRLLEKIAYDSTKDELVLLGDYVDRGPDSKRVLEKVMQLQEEGAIVLRGNHEELMISSTEGDEAATKVWLTYGGVETLASYGIEAATDHVIFPTAPVFKKHLDFIQTLAYYYETEEFIFVHAGVDPELPLAETPPSVLAWIRGKFHDHYNGEKTVVFGHTPTPRLHKEENPNVYFGDNNIIGIDGGACYGGQLNCLEVQSGEVTIVT